MHVSRVELSNIRCYAGSSMDLSQTVNLIAGENNTGKSTILQSIYMLQSPVLGTDSVRFGTPAGSICVYLENAAAERFPPALRDFVRNSGQSSARIQWDYVVANGSFVQRIFIQKAEASYQPFSQTQPDNFIVPYLSDRRAFGFTENVGAAHAFSTASTLHNLASKVDRCLTSNELNGLYQDACRKVLGFVVTTYPSANGKFAGLEISARRQQYVPINKLGSGVAQAVGLIVELLVAEGQVFLLEEIENDLHPTAMRALLDLVEKSAESGNQFLISTHSNVVLRRLGSVPNSRIWQTVRGSGLSRPAESSIVEVANVPTSRRLLLESLGYDLSDYDLYDSWLILEESSGEKIVREFVIPWFYSALGGRIRTVAAQGASDVEPRFMDLHRLLVFTHLEPVYKGRAWAITDGDEAGRAAMQKLRDKFADWPTDNFQYFSEVDFELYYPVEFGDKVRRILAIEDRRIRRFEKAALCAEVVIWLRQDPDRGKAALLKSAGEVIERIKMIGDVVTKATARQ